MSDDILSTHCMVVELRSVDTLTILSVATPDASENSGIIPLRFNSSSRELLMNQVTPVASSCPPTMKQVKVVRVLTATTFIDGDSIATIAISNNSIFNYIFNFCYLDCK